MGWFNIVSSNKVDEDILFNYLEIEELVKTIKTELDQYLNYLYQYVDHKTLKKNKNYYSILKIKNFVKKIDEDFGYCYTLRQNWKHYNFDKTARSRAEKLKIQNNLLRIHEILKKIHEGTSQLSKTKIKSNNLIEVDKNINEVIQKLDDEIKKGEKREHIFKKIKEKDEYRVFKIIKKIIKESEENEKKGLWLIDQKNKEKINFSQNLSIREIKHLDMVPILELEGLDKRSLYLNEIHKDDTLPLFHYNLLINGKNIHVVPKQYKKRIEPFLISA